MSKLFTIVLLAFFFFLPLQTRWIFKQPMSGGVPYEYGALSVFATEVLGWLVILFGLLHFRNLRGTSVFVRSDKNYYTVFVLIFALIIWAFISIIWAPDHLIALQSALRLLEALLLFWIVADYVRLRPENLHSIILVFIGGAMFQAGLGIYQFLTQSSFASTILGMAPHDPSALGTSVAGVQSSRWLRAYGGLPHPNVLGGYLAVALALSVWLLQQTQKTPVRRFVLFAVPILFTGIFFSFSRAAWIAAGIALGYWIFRLFNYDCHSEECNDEESRRHVRIAAIRPRSFATLRMTKLYALLIISYTLTLAVLYRPLIKERFYSDSRLEAQSRIERTEGLREAWQVIKTRPLLGVGLGNYTQFIAREIRPDDTLWSYQPVHNVPLLIWAELGLVGLLLFFSVLYYILRHEKFHVLRLTSYVLLPLLLLDHYLWTLPFGILLFWIILSLFQGRVLSSSVR